jgi:hypothetical protein
LIGQRKSWRLAHLRNTKDWIVFESCIIECSFEKMLGTACSGTLILSICKHRREISLSRRSHRHPEDCPSHGR